MPNFRGVRFTNAHETLIWAQKVKGNPYTFNYQMMKAINRDSQKKGKVQMRSDWKLPLCTGKERLKINGEKAHPTQKPEALLERVVLSSTNPGDIILDPFFGTGTTGAVAKRFRRHWIGIEAETDYISIAQKRIDLTIQRNEITDDFQNKRHTRLKRIPFVSLVQKGLLKEGQVLYFGKDGDQQSVVLPDGRIRYGEYVGSIHKVGRQILRAPCNGWLAWYYFNENEGKREPIDALRQKLREEIKLSGNNDANLAGEG